MPVRDDDIIIATAYKCGTTWMQNIVLKLVFQGKALPTNAADLCPWLDFRVPPIEAILPLLEAVTHRRQLKTHLRLDALKFYEQLKYIYVARDGRDCYMSWVNHYRKSNDLMYQALNDTPPERVGPEMPIFSEELHSEKVLFDRWVSEGWPSMEGETDGYPVWSLFDHVNSWWKFRHLPNILFIHYNDLLNDLPKCVRNIAAHLDIPIQEEGFDEMVESLTFAAMKRECNDPAKTLVPLAGTVFEGGGDAFINKGTNGRWKNVLSEEQLAKYDAKVKEKLSPEAAAWLEHGKLGFDPKSNLSL